MRTIVIALLSLMFVVPNWSTFATGGAPIAEATASGAPPRVVRTRRAAPRWRRPLWVAVAVGSTLLGGLSVWKSKAPFERASAIAQVRAEHEMMTALNPFLRIPPVSWQNQQLGRDIQAAENEERVTGWALVAGGLFGAAGAAYSLRRAFRGDAGK